MTDCRSRSFSATTIHVIKSDTAGRCLPGRREDTNRRNETFSDAPAATGEATAETAPGGESPSPSLIAREISEKSFVAEIELVDPPSDNHGLHQQHSLLSRHSLHDLRLREEEDGILTDCSSLDSSSFASASHGCGGTVYSEPPPSNCGSCIHRSASPERKRRARIRDERKRQPDVYQRLYNDRKFLLVSKERQLCGQQDTPTSSLCNSALSSTLDETSVESVASLSVVSPLKRQPGESVFERLNRTPIGNLKKERQRPSKSSGMNRTSPCASVERRRNYTKRLAFGFSSPSSFSSSPTNRKAPAVEANTQYSPVAVRGKFKQKKKSAASGSANNHNNTNNHHHRKRETIANESASPPDTKLDISGVGGNVVVDSKQIGGKKNVRFAISLQSLARQRSCLLRYGRCTRAVVCLQRFGRGSLWRERFCRSKRAAVSIQSFARKCLARRRRRRRLLQDSHRSPELGSLLGGGHGAGCAGKASFRRTPQEPERANIEASEKEEAELGEEYEKEETVLEDDDGVNGEVIEEAEEAALEEAETFKCEEESEETICTQRRIRRGLDGEVVQEEDPAIRIQCAARGESARRHYRATLSAALTIQSNYRIRHQPLKLRQRQCKQVSTDAERSHEEVSWSQSQPWIKLAREGGGGDDDAVGSFACGVGAKLAYLGWIRVRQSVVVLQARARGKRQRSCYLSNRASAVLLQAMIRGFLIRRENHRLILLSIIMQRHWRGALARLRQSVQVFRAAVKLQCLARRFLVRRKIYVLLIIVIGLQQFWRKTLARIRSRNRTQLRSLAVWMQAIVRSRVARSRFFAFRRASVTIQKIVRTQQARARHVASMQLFITLQSTVRGKLARKRFREMRDSVVTLQRLVRTWIDRSRWLSSMISAVFLQRCWRKYLTHQRFIHLRQSTIRVQALIRRTLVRKAFVSLLRACISVQVVVRGKLARTRYPALQNAVVSCQPVSIVYYASIPESSIICLQRWWRDVVFQKELLHAQERSVSIQAVVRRKLIQSRFEVISAACVTIQSAARMRRERRAYLFLLLVLVDIQALWRGALTRQYFARVRAERHFFGRQKAAISLQRYWRGHVTHEWLFLALQSILVIQANARGVLTRRHWLVQRSACIVIQSTARMRSVRRQFLSLRIILQFIQACWRGALVRRNWTPRPREPLSHRGTSAYLKQD